MIRETICFVDYQRRAHLASRLMKKLYNPRLNSRIERLLTAIILFNNLALVCVEDAQIKTAGRQQGRCSSSTVQFKSAGRNGELGHCGRDPGLMESPEYCVIMQRPAGRCSV